MSSIASEFERLMTIMDELREKCPWDKKQTIHSLRQMTLEETYELAEAISANDWNNLREELGDLMLHLVFYARIGKEEGRFSMYEVLHGICEKLIARHPHVYGEVTVNDAEEVKKNWEQLKLKEGKTSVLSGIPASLPAAVKAMRLQEKARQVGFEWENAGQVWEKVEEEMQELKAAVAAGQSGPIEEELGDVFFSLINYSRFLQVDAEHALSLTNNKFINRFKQMESLAALEGKNLRNMSLAEMDALWNAVKKQQQS